MSARGGGGWRERAWVRVPDSPAERRRLAVLLNVIAVVAVLDVCLLAPLIWASLGDRDSLVSVLGPIHGFGYLLLLGLCVRGADNRWWGWWFPALVLVTLGPLGSLIGDLVVRRRLRAAGG